MSTAEAIVHAALAAATPLTALVSTRIYALNAAQASTMPCVVYARTATSAFPVLTGDSKWSRATITVESMDEGSGSWADVRAIADAVRDALATVAVFQGQQDSADPERELIGISQVYGVIEEV